jgi:hypothetical protein
MVISSPRGLTHLVNGPHNLCYWQFSYHDSAPTEKRVLMPGKQRSRRCGIQARKAGYAHVRLATRHVEPHRAGLKE